MEIRYRANLGQVLGQRLDQARARIAELSAAELASTPQDAIVKREMERIGVTPLEFDFDGVSLLDEGRTRRGTRQDQFGRTVSADFTDYTVAIPFTGDALLVDSEPTGPALGGGASLMGGLANASLTDSAVHLQVTTWAISPDDVQRRIKTEIARAQDWLTRQTEFANNYVRVWTPQTAEALKAAIVRRQAVLETKSSVVAALGIPIQKADHPVPIKATATPIKVKPKRVTQPARPAEPEYVLEDPIFDDIVATIQRIGDSAVRLPTTSQKLGETDLRNVILFVLNANYQGQAVGEAFSGKGKTDLFLPWEGKVAFIGECKIWHGEAKFLEAFDQLAGYTTWNDTKVALIVFADPSSMTDVQTKARSALANHASLVESMGADRFLMTHPSDAAKTVTVVLIYVAAKLKDDE